MSFKHRLSVQTWCLATDRRERRTATDEDIRIAQLFYKKVILPHSKHPITFERTYIVRWRPNQSITMWWRPCFGVRDAFHSADVNFRFSWRVEEPDYVAFILNLALLMHKPFGVVLHWPPPKAFDDGKTTRFFFSCLPAG